MTLDQRIQLMVQLGTYLNSGGEFLDAVMHRTEYNNGWLTKENCKKAAGAIAGNYLQAAALKKWAQQYQLSDNSRPLKIGVVMAGNIPLVGFHDLLAVFLSGNEAIIKLSDKDKYLMPHLIQKLISWDKRAASCFQLVDKLAGFDAVIATGSNNSARYFEQYFGNYPNIIRKSRNGIAILDGTESRADLYALGEDVFSYFGLGCRNVSKLYVPTDYDFDPLLEALHEYRNIILNNKYKNNFDYNYAMYLLNKVPHKANGCIILIENEAIPSRIASLHYEFYDKADNLVTLLQKSKQEIQCIVGRELLSGISMIPFGKAQQPELTDYADGIDTMTFLKQL